MVYTCLIFVSKTNTGNIAKLDIYSPVKSLCSLEKKGQTELHQPKLKILHFWTCIKIYHVRSQKHEMNFTIESQTKTKYLELKPKPV